MNNQYRDMYDGIHASQELKKQTVEKMLREKQKCKKNIRTIRPIVRFAVAGVVILVLTTAGVGAYTVQAEDSYISVESNAVVGLSVNRWNKVIAVDCQNEKAAEMMEVLQLKGLNYDQAVDAILTYETETGSVVGVNELRISVDCEREEKAKELQKEMDKTCEEHNYQWRGTNNNTIHNNTNSSEGQQKESATVECDNNCNTFNEQESHSYSHSYQHGKENGGQHE